MEHLMMSAGMGSDRTVKDCVLCACWSQCMQTVM